MFFDGRIRLTFLQIDAVRGLTGLSQGLGIPAGFKASDFSEYGGCDGSPTLSIARAGNDTILSWSAIPGRNYRLQTNATVGTSFWTNAGPDIIATSSTQSITNSFNGPQRFYRLQLLP